MPSGCLTIEMMRLPSLRGALATKQSSLRLPWMLCLFFARFARAGLLRFARNDGLGTAMGTSPVTTIMPSSMQEVPRARVQHHHAVLVGGCSHLGITLRAPALHDMRDAGACGAIDVIAERNGGVR